MANEQKIMKPQIYQLLNIFYPIGSYYETSNANFNPGTAWGGTWVLETSGLVHVSGDTNDANYPVSVTYTDANNGKGQKQGGNKDAIIPYHRHSVSKVSDAITGGSHFHTTYREKVAANGTGRFIPGASATSEGVNTNSKTHTHDLPAHNTNYAGTDGNTNNANMQPYINVYRWHRVA